MIEPIDQPQSGQELAINQCPEMQPLTMAATLNIASII